MELECLKRSSCPQRVLISSNGHTYFGVKWQILPLPLCIKGKFYAKVVVVYITTAFYAIEFGVKSPCEESWPPTKVTHTYRENFTPVS